MVQFSNSLASAFGVTEEPETAIPQTDFATNTPQLRDELAALRQSQQPSEGDVLSLRQAQEQSLGQHQQVAASRQALQSAVTDRQADLDVTRQFLQLTDPNTPKPARAYLWKHFAKSIGGDPASEGVRDMGRLLTQLDPESLSNLRGAVVEASGNAQQPGAVRALLSATVRGELPASELFTRVADFSQRRAGQSAAEVAQSFPASDTPQAAGAPRPQNYHVAPENQEINGGWASVIPGMQPGTRYRRGDARNEFGVQVPEGDAEGKALTEFRTRQSDYLKLQDQLGNLHNMIQGNPDALGPSGTVSQWADNIASQLSNFDKGRLERRINVEADKWIRSLAPGDPDKAAVLRSRFAELSFSMARTMSGPGVLSQADVEAAATTLGNSWSAGQTTSVLRDVGARGFAAYQEWTRGQLGKELGLPTENMSDRSIMGLSTSEATPQSLRDAAYQEYERRAASRQANQPGQPPMQAGKRGDTRRSPTPEQEEEGFRQQAATEVRQGQEDRQRRIRREGESDVRANTQLELAIEQFRRAAEWRAEDKAEVRQKRIADAFKEFGKAIGASAPRMSAPSGGSGGGGQDSRAFVLPEKKQRRAPDIPNLRRGK